MELELPQMRVADLSFQEEETGSSSAFVTRRRYQTKPLTRYAVEVVRFGITDRAGAALANALMWDQGVVTETDKSELVDRNKIRREKARVGTLLLAERDAHVQNLTCIGFDSKKDQKVISRGFFFCTLRSESGSRSGPGYGSGSRLT